MKENFTVFVPSTFLFLFEFSLRWEEIRVSGVFGVVSGMCLLLLILQALGCVGDVWLVVGSAKRTFFLCGGPQFESSSSIGRIHDLIGIAAGSNMIGLMSARKWACIVCVLWPADELRECRYPWNLFSSIQYFDVLKIKFIQIMMSRYWGLRENWKKVDNINAKEITDSTLQFPAKIFDKFRSWWLRENWKQVDSIDAKGLTESSLQFFDKFRSWWLRENWRQVDSIDAKDLTESTLQFSTEIQKSISESLNSNFSAVVISYSCEDFAAVFDKISRSIIKTHQLYFFLQCK